MKCRACLGSGKILHVFLDPSKNTTTECGECKGKGEVSGYSFDFEVGWGAAILAAVKAVEARRVKVLNNKEDPSWTEHFAELQGELQALKPENM